ncbi:MAG: hypothetical protein ACYDIA_00625 [Candidatus Humimicrobiaceae bacterium]
MKEKVFNPKEFLKARHPDYFSDSEKIESPALDRSILEYHLDTITSRNDEINFEIFAKKLSERTICPNLLPHTGPTGGGDSKVDSETYPVSDALSIFWYEGIGLEASNERWAFAFSAKKEWKSKAKSDILKIFKVGRGYKKVFFISNQFISDKNRSEFEDEFSKKYDFDLRILDRNWILNKTFENDYEKIAIDTLKLSTSLRREDRKGPLDINREKELENIEEQIEEMVQQNNLGLTLVDYCIQSSILFRNMEKSALETEGRFQRAIRIAEKYGLLHQKIESLYQKSWYTFWWLMDYEQFIDSYSKVESLVIKSDNIYDLELLSNLWLLLNIIYKGKKIDEKLINYDEKTSALISKLEELKKEINRPSSSLQAETLLLLVDLLHKNYSTRALEETLDKLRHIVKKCKGLLGYPFIPLVNTVNELGNYINNSLTFDKLFEEIIEVFGEREQEVTSARLLLKRGIQQLHAKKTTDAIILFGRALNKLYKEESRQDLFHALYLCEIAYEQLDLLWAARGSMLFALHVALENSGDLNSTLLFQYFCIKRLKWLELQIGRIAQALSWHKLYLITKNQLPNTHRSNEDLNKEEEVDFDVLLGILFLKTNFSDLRILTNLPDILNELSLNYSSIALRYALGYEDDVYKEINFIENNETNIYDFFLKWRDQQVSSELPPMPNFYYEKKVLLTSKILGCDFILKSENESSCIDLSESILSGIESLFATGTRNRIFLREPSIIINLQLSDYTEKPFRFELTNNLGKPSINIICSSIDFANLSMNEQFQVKDKLFELFTSIFSRLIVCGDLKEVIKNLMCEEKAFDRAINFTNSSFIFNTLDFNNINLLQQSGENLKEYKVIRLQPWDSKNGISTLKYKKETAKENLKEFSEEPIDLENIKHKQIATISLIREDLWNKAKWSGTAFVWSPDYSPLISPMFKDIEAAQLIFDEWLIELGKDDKDDRLRITIIKGVDVNKPFAYRVIVGTNFIEKYYQDKINYLVLLSRVNTMIPSSDYNLKKFLENYKIFGNYSIAPSTFDDDVKNTKMLFGKKIEKSILNVRDAWEIGKNDRDSIGISPSDKPIIPDDKINPPVFEILNLNKK